MSGVLFSFQLYYNRVKHCHLLQTCYTIEIHLTFKMWMCMPCALHVFQHTLKEITLHVLAYNIFLTIQLPNQHVLALNCLAA